jgi:hypothetical protein
MMRSRNGGRFTRKTALLICMACGPAFSSTPALDHPRWAVRVSSDGHNYFIGQPNCHPLAYFLKETSRLNYHHYATIHIEPGKTEDEAKSLSIGEVAGRPVEQINHDIDIDDGKFFLKIIVVQRGTGEFCEIYHQEWMSEQFYQEVLPASLAVVGSETILMARDRVSGNGNWFDEHYWTFDKDGPIDLQVSERIRELLKKLLPPEYGVMNGGGFNVENLSYDLPVWGPQDGHCCPSGGKIHFEFALEDHQMVVASQKYDSD